LRSLVSELKQLSLRAANQTENWELNK
jgi:hypothetical protein